MSTTTGSPGWITRSETSWCGLAPFGPAATMVKSALAWPAARIAWARSAPTSASVRPGRSQSPIRWWTASMVAPAQASAANAAGAAEGLRHEEVRVGAVGVVDDAQRLGDRRLGGRPLQGRHDEGRFAVNRKYQAGEALGDPGRVPGQVPKIGAWRDEQRIEPGGGRGALGDGEPLRRVEVLVDHGSSLTLVWAVRCPC